MPFDGTNLKQDEVLDALKRARELISQPGKWHQGEFRSADWSRVCALGAILDSSPGISDDLYNDAAWALVYVLPRGYNCPATYNDAPGRTQAEIVALFNRAIAMREAGGE